MPRRHIANPQPLSRRTPTSPLECATKWKFALIPTYIAEVTNAIETARKKGKKRPPAFTPPPFDNRLACKLTRFRLGNLLADLAAVGLAHEVPQSWNGYINRQVKRAQYEQMLVILTEPLPQELRQAQAA